VENFKLHMKVGPHEFDGEGPADAVRKSFDDWKSLVASMPSAETTYATANSSLGGGINGSAGVLEAEELARLFVHDEKKGIVTLRILPRGDDRDANAALLVLLGFRQLKSQDEVPVTQLKPALKQSGCNVDRVDAVVGKYQREGFINKGGSGKGGKYSLTNSGIEKAHTLTRTMF
jgi:hypothetical protein